jgi:hypothetical protein
LRACLWDQNTQFENLVFGNMKYVFNISFLTKIHLLLVRVYTPTFFFFCKPIWLLCGTLRICHNPIIQLGIIYIFLLTEHRVKGIDWKS